MDTWLICLICGLGGLACLVTLLICYYCMRHRRRKSQNDSRIDNYDVEAQRGVNNVTNVSNINLNRDVENQISRAPNLYLATHRGNFGTQRGLDDASYRNDQPATYKIRNFSRVLDNFSTLPVTPTPDGNNFATQRRLRNAPHLGFTPVADGLRDNVFRGQRRIDSASNLDYTPATYKLYSDYTDAQKKGLNGVSSSRLQPTIYSIGEYNLGTRTGVSNPSYLPVTSSRRHSSDVEITSDVHNGPNLGFTPKKRSRIYVNSVTRYGLTDQINKLQLITSNSATRTEESHLLIPSNQKQQGVAHKNISTNCKQLDLHQFTLKEAMTFFKMFLKDSLNEYRESQFSRKTRYIEVITGRGKHSVLGIPVIKPAVENYLVKHEYKYVWANPGRVRIDLLSSKEIAC